VSAAPQPGAAPLAVTMGEPAGVGLDITLGAWVRRRELALPAFYCLADPAALGERAGLLGLDCPVEVVAAGEATAAFDRALPVVAVATGARVVCGAPDPANAAAVIESVTRAVGDLRAGRAAAMVTNPISKATLYRAGFAHPGHTEFLAALSADWTGRPVRAVMMLAGPQLRVVPVTVHIPLREVAATLTTDLIVDTGRIVAADLRRRFAVARPRLALAGLNPHAGEGGAFGDEDARIVRPAVDRLNAEGIAASGPLAADSMFHPAARAGYDAALCMYHDQALIAVKTLDFGGTVNVTLGLPFVRTSPDHGTALDIVGSGRADPASLVAALRLAAELARDRTAA